MRCSVGAIDRLCLLCWRGRPEADDVRRMADGVVEAWRAARRPLILVAYGAPDLALPSAAARRELVRLTPLVDRACEAQYIVLEGDSVPRKAIRGLVTAIVAVMRAPVTMVHSVEEAVARASARVGLDPTAVSVEARARGLLPT